MCAFCALIDARPFSQWYVFDACLFYHQRWSAGNGRGYLNANVHLYWPDYLIPTTPLYLLVFIILSLYPFVPLILSRWRLKRGVTSVFDSCLLPCHAPLVQRKKMNLVGAINDALVRHMTLLRNHRALYPNCWILFGATKYMCPKRYIYQLSDRRAKSEPLLTL